MSAERDSRIVPTAHPRLVLVMPTRPNRLAFVVGVGACADDKRGVNACARAESLGLMHMLTALLFLVLRAHQVPRVTQP